MKTIPLTKGMVAIVDDGDFEFLSKWKWYACKTKGGHYARRDQVVGGQKLNIYMHRVLTAATVSDYVDHVDRNRLNNQRLNLRICNQSQNMGNSAIPINNTTGFKGVCFDKSRSKYLAYITRNDGSLKYLGRYETPLPAAMEYDRAAIEKYSEFALTNAALGLL